MAFAMSAMAAALPARVAGSRRPQPAPRVALSGFVEGGLRRSAGLGASTESEGVAALGGVSNGCKWTMMRHGKKIHRLGRPADQRKALLRALTTQLLTHGAIETTKTKAKAVRPWIDKMVNLAKDGSDAKKNQAYAWIYDKKIVNALFDEAPARYADRRNDYTFIKLQERKRRGDGVDRPWERAPQALNRPVILMICCCWNTRHRVTASGLITARVPSMLRSALRLRPAARALSSWAPSGGDRVLLRGLLFHAYHGVLPAERALGQKFELDLALSVDLRAAGASDALDDTISYADVYDCVRAVVQGPPRQLVETVAEQVAAAVLRDFPAASAVAVRVVKPHVAMPGALHSLGVEIFRSRVAGAGRG